MTKKQIDQIKHRMRKKFGTIRFFCKMTNLNEKKIRHFLSGKMNSELMDRYNESINDLLKAAAKINFINPDVIQPHERELVRVGILTRFKSVKGFCEKHPQFTKVFISNVINGRRIRRDKRVDELIKFSQKK